MESLKIFRSSECGSKQRFASSLALALVALVLASCQAGTSEPSNSEQPVAGTTRTPLEVVNQRMQAYNAHDLDSFLSTYSEDVEIFTYPDRSLGRGRERIESLFEELFREGSVQVEIHHQIAKDGYVINHETVVSGLERTEYVSIYEVRDGLIRSVRFVRD